MFFLNSLKDTTNIIEFNQRCKNSCTNISVVLSLFAGGGGGISGPDNPLPRPLHHDSHRGFLYRPLEGV